MRKIEIIRVNTNKMNQLILDLLSMANITRCQLNQEEISMNYLVRNALNDHVSDISPTRDEILVDDLPPAYGDPVLLKILWSSLIDNAIKFTKAKESRKIHIRGEIKGASLVYSIQDNGIGFNPAYLDKLFKPFHTLEPGDTIEDSTGIGLALVQRVVIRHSGTVWAIGEEGVGATFYVSLPREV